MILTDNETKVDLLNNEAIASTIIELLRARPDLCWGKKALDKIMKWEGPMKFGDYQEAGITYTYKVNNLADWAKKPEVQAAFPVVKSVLDGAGSKESKHAVKLTSQGWEAKGLD
ncbi:hypothetical protein [Thauera butanivorans]|uniref:hypothetical protein n=1 Tax=Thauera butanivorans TaxID=86174 RepID=UPI000A014A0C|nr:hypothetical protein [Thauera butanivorans]